MAKEKRTKLHPWQKAISKEEYMAEIEKGSFGVVGYFPPTKQYYKIDSESKDYKGYLATKAERKKERKEKIAERRNVLKEEIKKLKGTIKEKDKEIRKIQRKALSQSSKAAERIARIKIKQDKLDAEKRECGLIK